MTADGKLITGAGKAYDSGRGGFFVCVSVFFFFFMKAILSFFEKLMTADGVLDYRGGKGL